MSSHCPKNLQNGSYFGEMAPEIFYFVCYLTIREENTVSYLGALLTHCLPITDGIIIG